MAKATMSNEAAWFRNGSKLAHSQWVDELLYRMACPAIDQELRLEIALSDGSKHSPANVSVAVLGNGAKQLIDLGISFPDRVLGLDKLATTEAKTTYQGVFFNTTPGELACNLFEFIEAISKGVAAALVIHFDGMKDRLSPLQTFEVTGHGFDASSDATDDRVFWVQAHSRGEVESAIEGTNAIVHGQIDGESDIDFVLPKQALDLRKALQLNEAQVCN